MAQTYTIGAYGVVLTANKVTLCVFNGAGSGRIVRLYRAWILNNQYSVSTYTGVLTTLELRLTTSGSGGVAITPLKHDSNSESFPAQVVCGTGMTIASSSLFLRAVYQSEEPKVSALTMTEALAIPSYTNIWDCAYNDANIEPIVCREGQGVYLINITTTTSGLADVFFEVTLANT